MTTSGTVLEAVLDHAGLDERMLHPEILTFLDHAARSLLGHGLTLGGGNTWDLVAVNEANRDSWLPLFPTFDPRHGALGDDEVICILVRNREGRVVATQATRLFNWPDTTFADEAESLRLLYRDPASSRRPDESCTCTSETARRTRGRVVFSGSVWVHPACRGAGLPTFLPRIGRALAQSRWGQDVTVAMMSEGNVRRGLAARTGYKEVDWAIDVRNCPMGDVHFGFMSLKPHEIIEDLQALRQH